MVFGMCTAKITPHAVENQHTGHTSHSCVGSRTACRDRTGYAAQPDLADDPEHYNDSRADKYSYGEKDGSRPQAQRKRDRRK